MTELDWRQYGECKLLDPEVMFPAMTDTADVVYAREVCHGCQVRDECLEDALSSEKGVPRDSRYGIRAGRTPGERYNIQMMRRPSKQNQSETRPSRAQG